MMTHKYQINGMTCGSCVATVENLLEEVPGIKDARISLADKSATLDMDRHVNITELKKAFVNHPKYGIEEEKKPVIAPTTEIEEEAASFWVTYKPILLIFGYLLGLTVLIELVSPSIEWMRWMRHFMAGFFLVFSFFKMLDLPAFAVSYSTYDILAKRWNGWGYIYPFAELILGVLFLINFEMLFTNIATFIIMGVSTIGVLQSVLAKRKIRCACLGAVFNLPMSTITLVEDLLMVLMSAFMIFYHFYL